MTKKLLSLILALLMLIPMAVACAETPTEEGGTSENPAATTVAPAGSDETPDSTELISNTLPGDLKFGGETVVFLSRDSAFVNDEISVDDMNGSMVNDAVYKRNEKVQEQLDVVFDSIKITGDNYVVSTELRNAANNGETYFDIAANSTYSTIMYTGENILLDLTDCEYLDLDAVYWSQGFNQHASIGDSQYLATGAIAISLFRYMFVTFYNKNMLESAQYENLYDVVDEKRWTLDYQIQLSKDLYKDNDGSGSVSEGDAVGFATSTVLYVDPYWSSCDIPIITKDADNLLEFNLDKERLSNVVDKLITLYHESDAWVDNSSGDDGKQNALGSLFGSGLVGTTTMRLCSVETQQFISMQDEYGVIPVPKYDEAQDKYYTYLHDQFTSVGIPSALVSDEEKVQMLGAVLEAMALESYKSVVPAYYETALKGRYLEDSESWRMLDMIYENVKVDAGVLYTKSLESIHQMPRDMVKNGRNSVSSTVQRVVARIEKNLLPALLEDLLALQK
ncbi:MAG: hypothetical protein IJD70_00940 [Clostridia bacterium]|nr:hypothetical protein [Clostridia bacterium]